MLQDGESAWARAAMLRVFAGSPPERPRLSRSIVGTAPPGVATVTSKPASVNSS